MMAAQLSPVQVQVDSVWVAGEINTAHLHTDRLLRCEQHRTTIDWGLERGEEGGRGRRWGR